MASILTTARLVCKDTQARQKAIESFQKIIDYTTPNEPKVLQYVCALPYDDQAGNELYVIEESVFSRCINIVGHANKEQIRKPSVK